MDELDEYRILANGTLALKGILGYPIFHDFISASEICCFFSQNIITFEIIIYNTAISTMAGVKVFEPGFLFFSRGFKTFFYSLFDPSVEESNCANKMPTRIMKFYKFMSRDN